MVTIPNLLLLTIYCVATLGSKRFEKLVYAPFGPTMCRQFCADSVDAFSYVKENLSCHRFPSEICPKEDKMQYGGFRWNVTKGQDICYADLQDAGCTGIPETVQYNSNCTIHQACEVGNLGLVKYLISQQMADINHRGMWGRTPVMVAANSGQVEVFDYLVCQGCNISLVDDHNETVLHIACRVGNMKIVRKLIISMKYDKELRGQHGYTAVMIAAYHGHKDVFDFLVSKDWNLTVIDFHQNNLLHIACFGGSVDIVKTILSQTTIHIDSRGFARRTPVMKAAFNGKKDVLGFLVSMHCKLRAIDSHRNNILHIACLRSHVDIVQVILSLKEINIDSRGDKRRTPLMMSVQNGLIRVFDLLVSSGSNPLLVDIDKNNILHIACLGGYVEMTKAILSLKKINIDSRGFERKTPLMMSVQNGHKNVSNLLVSSGSNLSAFDENENNILHIASRNDRLQLVKYILSNKLIDIESRGFAERTPVMMAAELGKIRLFNYFMSEGCDLKVVDKFKNNILHVACLGGHPDMVKHILSRGICGIESKGFQGQTPVLMAASKGHIEIINLLRKKGCNLRAEDKYGNSVLHLACYLGNVDVVQHLLSLRVSEEKENKYGQTPLQVARYRRQREVVTLLSGRK